MKLLLNWSCFWRIIFTTIWYSEAVVKNTDSLLYSIDKKYAQESYNYGMCTYLSKIYHLIRFYFLFGDIWHTCAHMSWVLGSINKIRGLLLSRVSFNQGKILNSYTYWNSFNHINTKPYHDWLIRLLILLNIFSYVARLEILQNIFGAYIETALLFAGKSF